MRRILIRIEDVADRANLVEAFRLASRGKRHRPDQRAFAARLDAELDALRQGILVGDLPLGQARRFLIHDPKRRAIHAPVFRERVLHHALMRPLAPVLERRLCDHSYACRAGGGQFAALDTAQRRAIAHPWFLKLDVRSYFDSIPHDGVLARLARVVKGAAVLALVERIVRSHGRAGRGLPIGALTSQHLANLYLEPLDRLVQEELGAGGYVRYMDDLLLWGECPWQLARWHRALVAGAADLGLAFKPPQIARSAAGMDALGWRVYPGWRRLDRRSRRRLTRRWRALDTAWVLGGISEADASERMGAALAWAGQGETRGLRQKIHGALLARNGGRPAAAPPPARAGSTAAAAGTTTPGTAARPIATGTSRATGTTTWVSGSLPSPVGVDAPGGPPAVPPTALVSGGEDGTDPAALVGSPDGERDGAAGVAKDAGLPPGRRD